MNTELVFLEKLPYVAAKMGLNNLNNELPIYLQLCKVFLGTNEDICNPPPKGHEPKPCILWSFWRTYCLQLPNWYNGANEVALIMTSSACIERIFSLHNSLFSNKQEKALEDYKEGTDMLRFNYNQRNKVFV